MCYSNFYTKLLLALVYLRQFLFTFFWIWMKFSPGSSPIITNLPDPLTLNHWSNPLFCFVLGGRPSQNWKNFSKWSQKFWICSKIIMVPHLIFQKISLFHQNYPNFQQKFSIFSSKIVSILSLKTIIFQTTFRLAIKKLISTLAPLKLNPEYTNWERRVHVPPRPKSSTFDEFFNS